MSDLTEDENGVPYPVCVNCADQVCPPGALSSNPANWVHIFEGPDGDTSRRWGLNNCQRPTKGRYGDKGNQAEPPISHRAGYD